LFTFCNNFMSTVHIFFFFQAEDGIRDRNVTGVQTCALPISAIYTCASLRTLRWAESRLSSAFARFCSWILVCLAAVICARTLSLPKAMRDFFRLIAFFLP